MNAELKLKFGQILKALRRKLGLTQAQVAEKCDLHHSYISLIERGISQPTLETLVSLSEALEMNLVDLVGEFEKKQLVNIQE